MRRKVSCPAKPLVEVVDDANPEDSTCRVLGRREPQWRPYCHDLPSRHAGTWRRLRCSLRSPGTEAHADRRCDGLGLVGLRRTPPARTPQAPWFPDVPSSDRLRIARRRRARARDAARPLRIHTPHGRPGGLQPRRRRPADPRQDRRLHQFHPHLGGPSAPRSNPSQRRAPRPCVPHAHPCPAGNRRRASHVAHGGDQP